MSKATRRRDCATYTGRGGCFSMLARMVMFRGPVACTAFLLLASVNHAAAQSAPTFSQQIAPILRTHCVACHQPGGDAPFSLVSFADARQRANQIADVTSRRYMPPWKPDDAGVFAGERRLSDDDIDTIRRWARAGAPEGTPSGRASTADRASRWRNGEPDLIVTLPPYTLRADGPDVFRNFVVTIPGADAHYVRAWQFRPGSPAVHHANIRVDPTSASRRLDESDPQPGYEGMILHSADYPDGHFLGWTPGQGVARLHRTRVALRGGQRSRRPTAPATHGQARTRLAVNRALLHDDRAGENAGHAPARTSERGHPGWRRRLPRQRRLRPSGRLRHRRDSAARALPCEDGTRVGIAAGWT